jgi:hypothetical protein
MIVIGDILCPGLAPATAPALGVACARVAPVLLGRAAVALGVEEILRQSRTLLSEKFGGDKSSKAGSSKGRIENTPQEVRGYFQGLRDMKVLGKGRPTKDRHWAYEILKDCKYKGVQFKKGQFVSRDNKHHEVEWFRDKDYHLGALEPKGGTLYKPGKGSSRILKF